MSHRNLNPFYVQFAELSKASENTVAACQGWWEMLQSVRVARRPTPQCYSVELLEVLVLASPQGAPLGPWGKIASEPAGRPGSLDGICFQGQADLDDSAMVVTSSGTRHCLLSSGVLVYFVK